MQRKEVKKGVYSYTYDMYDVNYVLVYRNAKYFRRIHTAVLESFKSNIENYEKVFQEKRLLEKKHFAQSREKKLR